MASTTQAHERPTSLKGKKESFDFEIWAEIDGKPLEVYGITQGEDGVPEGWIASEAGKFYTVGVRLKDSQKYGTSPYPSMNTHCQVDGKHVKSISFNDTSHLRSPSGVRWDIKDHRISPTEVQRLLFAKPVLTENETPNLDTDKLASIVVCFKRCKTHGPRFADGTRTGSGSRSVVQINERSKKGVLSQVTAIKRRDSSRCGCDMARKTTFKALGHIPLEHNIKPGEDGLQKHQPICIDDDDQPRAVPSSNRAGVVKAETDVQVKAEVVHSGADGVSVIARQIAEAQAELEALQARQQMALAAKQPRSRTDDNEDDKENIMRGMRKEMNKKLKVAKEDDGGIVDLTFDDD